MNELQTTYTTGSTLYGVIRNTLVQVWNNQTNAFETYTGGNQWKYALVLNEQGSGSGFYSGNFPVAITVAATYTVIAYLQLSGGAPASGDTPIAEGNIVWDGITESLVGGDLITLAYAKSFLKLTVTTFDDLLQTMVDGASQAVKKFCNRDFVVTSYSETYDGKGSESLLINQTPIVALNQITLQVNDLNPIIVQGSNCVYNAKSGEIQFKPTAGLCSFYFPRGFQNIQVDYQAGYAAIPADLQQQTALIVQKLFYLSGKNLTLKSEKIGDYNYVNDALAVIDDSAKEVLISYRRLVI